MHEREQELRAAFAEGVPIDEVLGDELAEDDFDEVFGEPADDEDRESTR
jgi:hypothetical protein